MTDLAFFLLLIFIQSLPDVPHPLEVMFEKCELSKVDVPMAALTSYNEIVKSDHELSKKIRLERDIDNKVPDTFQSS